MSNPNLHEKSKNVSDKNSESLRSKESEGPDTERPFQSEDCASCAESIETTHQAISQELEMTAECEENAQQMEATQLASSLPSDRQQVSIPPDALPIFESDVSHTVVSLASQEAEATSRHFLANARLEGAADLSPQILEMLQRTISRDAVELFQRAESIPPEGLAIIRIAKLICWLFQEGMPSTFRPYVRNWVNALPAFRAFASRALPENSESASSATALPNEHDILDATKNPGTEVALNTMKSAIEEMRVLRDRLNETIGCYHDEMLELGLLDELDRDKSEFEDSEDDAMCISEDNFSSISDNNVNTYEQTGFPASQVTSQSSVVQQVNAEDMAPTEISKDAKRSLKPIEHELSTESNICTETVKAVKNPIAPSPKDIQSPALSATNSEAGNSETPLGVASGFEIRQRDLILPLFNLYELLSMRFAEIFDDLYEQFKMIRKHRRLSKNIIRRYRDKLPNENSESQIDREFLQNYRILEQLYRESTILFSILRSQLIRMSDVYYNLTADPNLDQESE